MLSLCSRVSLKIYINHELLRCEIHYVLLRKVFKEPTGFWQTYTLSMLNKKIDKKVLNTKF